MEILTDNYRLSLNPDAVHVVKRHALEAFPYECCGFLFGEDSTFRKINLAVPSANSKEGDQRRRFEISAKDYLWAEQYALSHNTQLLGIYHSHPNHPAIASEHDLAVAMPYFSYLIVSVYGEEIRDLKSWKLLEDERKFKEEILTLHF